MPAALDGFAAVRSLGGGGWGREKGEALSPRQPRATWRGTSRGVEGGCETAPLENDETQGLIWLSKPMRVNPIASPINRKNPKNLVKVL